MEEEADFPTENPVGVTDEAAQLSTSSSIEKKFTQQAFFFFFFNPFNLVFRGPS